MTIINRAWFISLTLLVTFTLEARTLTGSVIRIIDGDTLVILTTDKEQIKVRLTEIDAPEKKQPFGYKSKKNLALLCFQKNATIETTQIDKYGRVLGRVKCNGIDANLNQIAKGLAWVYDKYVTDRSLYKAQDSAKSQKIGLWSQPSPTPPWVYRHKGNK